MAIASSDINLILISMDIEGLIKSGAPNNEYEAEAATIATALQKVPLSERNEAAIAAILALVWEKGFSLSPTELQKRLPLLREVAQQILNGQK